MARALDSASMVLRTNLAIKINFQIKTQIICDKIEIINIIEIQAIAVATETKATVATAPDQAMIPAAMVVAATETATLAAA